MGECGSYHGCSSIVSLARSHAPMRQPDGDSPVGRIAWISIWMHGACVISPKIASVLCLVSVLVPFSQCSWWLKLERKREPGRNSFIRWAKDF